MRIGRNHRDCLTAHDISLQALQAYWATITTGTSPPKLSTEQVQALTQLSLAVETWQERIRIHRRQPLPSNKPRPARKNYAQERRRAERGQGLAAGPRAPTSTSVEVTQPSTDVEEPRASESEPQKPSREAASPCEHHLEEPEP